MVEAVADHDYGRALEIAGWPVVAVLAAYLEKLKRAAVAEYRNALLVWSSLAPHARKRLPPPEPPEILKD